MAIEKNFIKDISKEFEKAYINVCKTYGLKINLESENYTEELSHFKDYDIRKSYNDAIVRIKLKYCIKYVKSFDYIKPSDYKKLREFFIKHNEDYSGCYVSLILGMPKYVQKGWVKILKETKR